MDYIDIYAAVSITWAFWHWTKIKGAGNEPGPFYFKDK
jgi:hypothetical protein